MVIAIHLPNAPITSVYTRNGAMQNAANGNLSVFNHHDLIPILRFTSIFKVHHFPLN